MMTLRDLKARFPHLVRVVTALAVLGGSAGYAAHAAAADDCCYPGAPCCHPGAACCARHQKLRAS